MNKFHITLILVFGFCCAYGQKIAKTALVKDLIFLNEAFKHGHPLNLIRPQPIDFTQSIVQLNQELPDSISAIAFENVVRKILFEVGCVHINIAGWKNKRYTQNTSNKIFPFHVFCDGNKLWVHRNTNDSLQTNIKKGDEILAINTYSAKQIIDVLKYYHTVDGHSFDFNFNLINKYFPLLYAHCIEQSPLFAIQYRNSAAQVQTETLNAMIEKELKQPVKNATPLIAGHDEYFSVKNDSIGILTISSFHAVRKHFYKTVFAYLTRHKINNLVIDVRENLGGSRFNADELIAYLTKEKCKYEMIRPKHNLQAYCKGVNKLNFYLSYLFYDIGMLFESKTTQEGAVFTTNIAPKKNRYTGKTYVLANGYTGSSASQVASYIKHHANAKIIGQQTAGGELSNNGGSFSDIVLPNSRLAISVATYLMRYDIKSDNPNGIVPDYPIIYDINSYKTRDLELEKVFDLIANVPKTHF